MAIYGQFPIRHQVFLVYLNPGDYQLVFLRWQGTCQHTAILDRVHGNFALLVRMYMRQVMPFCVVKEHPYKNSVEHGYRRQSISSSLDGAQELRFDLGDFTYSSCSHTPLDYPT
jgi:hypothetical protein